MEHGWSPLVVIGLGIVLLGVFVVGLSGEGQAETLEPTVLVGIPDSGINPYHVEFYRPDLTDHPSTYIEGFPEDVQKLNISVEERYDEGVEADQQIWESVEPGQWYWIPKTPFVAVHCAPQEERDGALFDASQTCILDDGTRHGTATTSALLQENPDALIAFHQGPPPVDSLLEKGLPIDIVSVSWGTAVPLPLSNNVPPDDVIYVKAAGNDPRSTLLDAWSGHPQVISVGGAYPSSSWNVEGVTEDRSEELLSARETDVVAWFCRMVAWADHKIYQESVCGTSISAPTVAGGLSQAILKIREQTGYTGSLAHDGMVDALAGITKQDLRDAMNKTATYDPDHSHSKGVLFPVPGLAKAPWMQWGWGWYDHTTAPYTVLHLLEDEVTFEKPDEATRYMETTYQMRTALYGWHAHGAPAS